MSSTSDANQPAPWREPFLEHIRKMPSPEFVFGSLYPAHKGAPTDYLPRTRYCIFRGFWAELPENKHNEAPMNDRVFESDLPTFTTDVRMSKQFELFSSSHGKADDQSLIQGSGGGGPCEAVWWVKEGVMVQWRMRGQAYIVGPDIEGEGTQSKESSGVRTVLSEIGSRMRVVQEDKKDEWSWKTELTAHFGNMPPGTRGSFAGPPPGKPVDEPVQEEHLEVGTKVEDLHHPIARKNFRVVILKPDEVESVDLSDPKSSRRQFYKYDDASGTWSHKELWP